MKKIAAVLTVMLIAGCSGMGMGMQSSGGSRTSNTGSGSGSALEYQRQFTDPSGQLSIYHGG
jgi:uncharacterized lipoprotein